MEYKIEKNEKELIAKRKDELANGESANSSVKINKERNYSSNSYELISFWISFLFEVISNLPASKVIFKSNPLG